MRQLLTLAVLILAAGLARAEDPVAEPADHLIEFTVVDQFDAEHTGAEFAGKVMILFWGDREGSEHMERWDKTIRRKLKPELAAGSVDMRVVAHLQGVPGLIKGMVKGKFSKEPDEWALMDWEGVFTAAYVPTEKHLNILVFGPDGTRLHQVATTKLSQTVLDRVLAAVEQGLRDGGAPGRTSAPSASPAD